MGGTRARGSAAARVEHDGRRGGGGRGGGVRVARAVRCVPTPLREDLVPPGRPQTTRGKTCKTHFRGHAPGVRKQWKTQGQTADDNPPTELGAHPTH